MTDPTLIEKVLARDVLNIQKRVAVGEAITAAERAVLEREQARVAGGGKARANRNPPPWPDPCVHCQYGHRARNDRVPVAGGSEGEKAGSGAIARRCQWAQPTRHRTRPVP